MKPIALAEQQRVFEALADPTRLRMVHLLLRAKAAICQCEFVDSLKVSPANISRHAKVLLYGGLLTERREGKWVYYELGKDYVRLLRSLAQSEDPILEADRRQFQRRLKLRQSGKCLLGVRNIKFRKRG